MDNIFNLIPILWRLKHMCPTTFVSNFFPHLLINIIFFGLTKKGGQNCSSVAKLGYFNGLVTKVSSRVTLAALGAGVVCHTYTVLQLKKIAGSSLFFI